MKGKTDPINSYVVSSVRRIRIKKGIRVEDMARRAGIPAGSYSCLETGWYRMSLENLFRVLQVLETDIRQVWPSGITGRGERVDEELIERSIERARSAQMPLVTLEDVRQAVCGTYSIGPEDLSSSSRRRDLAEARAVAAVLVKETPHLALVDLSRMVKRDVSSLSHSIRRIHERISWNRELRLKIRDARRSLHCSHQQAAPAKEELRKG